MFHTDGNNYLLEELSTSSATPVEEDCWKLMLGFLQIAPHVPFPFADFTLEPSAVINDSHEYDNMLTPVSPPGS